MESGYGQIMICTSQTCAKILTVCIQLVLIVKGPNENKCQNNVIANQRVNITSFIHFCILPNIDYIN